MEPAVSPAQSFRFGLFEADVSRGTLTRNGLRVKIQDQPLRVLVLLLERPGEIVTREELRQKLWPEGTYVDFDGSLNVVLKKLRAAIGDESDNPRFVETVPRHGYRFIAPVTVLGRRAESSPAPEANIAQMSGLALLASQPPPAKAIPHSRWNNSHIYLSAAMLLMLAGIGWAVWRQRFGPGNAATRVDQAGIPIRKSVAVLGFRNTSGRVEDSWLATAFSEMLSTELAGGGKLRLVSGEDVAQLRITSPWSQTDTLDQQTTSRIGTALNGDLLVLGSYAILGRRNAGHLRVDVRMQDAKTGEILTEIAEIGGDDDLFQIVSRIGAKLRDRMGIPRLEDSEATGVLAALPLNREAAKFYVLGISKLRQFDVLAAKDLLQQAAGAEPKFVLAHAMLARAWGALGYEQKRREEVRKALDLSRALPRAERMLVEGDFYESVGDHQRAASVYHALFELFPDNVEYGLQLAAAQNAASHGSEALATLAQLRRLPTPASDDPNIDLTEARIVVNKERSLALIRRALEKASAQGKKLVYARGRHDECITLVYSTHPMDAATPCQEAYETFLAAGNRLAAADSLRLIGDRQGGEGHMDQAIATYERVLAMLQPLGDHEKLGAALNNMANAFMNQGELDRADQLFKQAEFHFDQAGDRRNALVAMTNLGDVRYLRGELPLAEKTYQDALQRNAGLDPGDPGYLLYRLGDLEMTEGKMKQARAHIEEAVKQLRNEAGQNFSGALLELADLLKSSGDLDGARRNFEESLAVRQKLRDAGLVAECEAEFSDLALEEQRPEDAELRIRPAIAEFEKENMEPDLVSAYTVLSRALLMQGKVDEARTAIERAAEYDRSTPDPSLRLPIEIERARVEAVKHAPASAQAARQGLRSAAATAKKLGYFNLECEARLALGEAEMKSDPAMGRSLLSALASEARGRGMELMAQQADRIASVSGNVVAANKSSR